MNRLIGSPTTLYASKGFSNHKEFGRCLNLFIEQGNLMKKMQFPRITLPAIVVGSNLLDNVLLFVSMLGNFALLSLFLFRRSSEEMMDVL